MTAKEYAKKQGFRDARALPTWNDRECYEAIYGNEGVDDVPNIGLPQIFFADGDSFRMATPDETLRYMDDITPEDGDEDGD